MVVLVILVVVMVVVVVVEAVRAVEAIVVDAVVVHELLPCDSPALSAALARSPLSVMVLIAIQLPE